MSTAFEQRAEGIIDDLLLLPNGDRAAAAKAACANDPRLLQRVNVLLASLQEMDGFMSDATVDAPAEAMVTERAGTMIGRYKLLQQIGEGGFGVVFMAEQERPVRRTVALKIIKLGMDTREVVARFEAERQALAMMDHPNIAKVLDAGATEAGRPFFVMELVRGSPITEYCDKRKMPARERVALLAQVCRAVQHAHGKGIIHRDLKPSNVMVTVADDRPIPKVIDFGIAKATQAKLTDRTLFTAYRQLIGTPQYMSPEQADSDGVDVDIRTDVYSLGVLLYELLVGTTPLDAKALRSAAYDEMRRQIRDVEPARPSTRLHTLVGDQLSTVATARGSDGKKLEQIIHGELDWIVMKALEKDRTRRYETAAAFADDLQRYLDGEAVLAGPVSGMYRMQKLVRRYKAMISIAAAVGIVLLTGIAGTTYGLIREAHQRQKADIAEKLAEKDRGEALAQKAEAERERNVAEANQAAAQGEFLVFQYNWEAAIPLLQKTWESRRDSLGAGDPQSIAALQELSIAVGNSGKPVQAKALFTDAIAAERLAGRAHSPGFARLLLGFAGIRWKGQKHEPVALYQEAADILRTAAPGDPDTLHALTGLTYYQAQGQAFAAARQSLDDLATVLRSWPSQNASDAMLLYRAGLLLKANNSALAERAFHLSLQVEPTGTQAMLPEAACSLVECLNARGDTTDAAAVLQDWFNRRHANSREVARQLRTRAGSLKNKERPADAELLYTEAVTLVRRAGEDGVELAKLLGDDGLYLQLDLLQPARAEPLLREATDILRTAAPADASRGIYLWNLADLLKAEQDWSGAEKLLRENLEFDLAHRRPNDTSTPVSLTSLNQCLAAEGKPAVPYSVVPVAVELVAVSHLDNGHVNAEFAIEGVPPPTANSLSATSRFSVVDGAADPACGGLDVLHDGKLPTLEDEPKSNFFFSGDGGRIAANLGAVIDIGQISTWSWHASERAPQVYTLYGADGTEAGFNAEPKNKVNPASCGWKKIASVDTHDQFQSHGGQYVVSIANGNSSLGQYRYLLFVIAKGTAGQEHGNTFYSEINIVPAFSGPGTPLRTQADALVAAHNFHAAQPLYLKAVELDRAAGSAARFSLADDLISLAEALPVPAGTSQAASAAQQAAGICQTDRPQHDLSLLRADRRLGKLLMDAGRPGDSIALWREAIAIDDTTFANVLDASEDKMNVARAQEQTNDLHAAEAMLRRALAQRQQATKCGFTSRETQATARQLAALLDKEKRPADADDIRAQAGLTLPAGVKVFVGHNDVAHATHDFKLSGMPPLTPNALSANSRLSIIDGSADGNSGPLDVLHDGKLANSADDPANNFFFGTDVNRLTADLGAVTDLKEINTYSWHTAERAPQVYTLYASDGAAPGFNPRPKNGTDPTSFGWKLLAVADTHHQFKDEAGQYGVSISGANGSLGKYRYLLFVIRKGTPDNVDGNTFYSEINIVPVNPQPPVAGQQR